MSEPALLPHLAEIESAVRLRDQTWRPDDPAYHADIYRQVMGSLSYAYFLYFHADAEHPDWAPLYNPVFNLQPNPDDIYIYSPIRGDLTYRVSGNRGTCHILSFTTQKVMSGTTDAMPQPSGHNEVDHDDLELALGEDFDVIFSAERPAGYTGKWARIDPQAGAMLVRYRMYDWANETDPQLSIECLNDVPLKPRLDKDEIVRRIEEIARFSARRNTLFYGIQNAVKANVGWNVFEPVRMAGALQKQIYWPACYQLEPDEALIIETELPETRPYWNIQLNDPLFNATEYVYRLASTNGHFARVSSDGRLRAVIAMEDPGVPNWLDPGGYPEGGIYGRWYNCSSNPTPTIKRVKLAKLRDHLPPDTPVVTPEERAEEIRSRVKACQRRRRW